MSQSNFARQSSALRLAGVQTAIAAGVEAAAGVGVPMAIVIVDRAGQLVSAARMDGATELALKVAEKKAWTSAMVGAPSGDVINFISGDPGASISMPHVEGFSVVPGGLPIFAGDECIGAAGVSGASSDLDLSVTKAVLAALAN